MAYNDLKDYIDDIVNHNDLDAELKHVRGALVHLHKSRLLPQTYRMRVKRYDQMFKALLTEKARQEALKKMSNHNRGNTENASPGKADDAGTSVGVGDILKEQVAGSG
jgi:hypothetical protein